MTTRRQFGLGVAALAACAGAARAETTLRVGSTPTGTPFTFLDTKTNTIQGIMVDLIGAIGAQAGFTPAVEPINFAALIPALTGNKIDLIAAAMFATPVRAEVIDFSDPVITYGEGLVVPAADKADYTDMEGLKGKVVGVQVGTAFVAPLQKSGLFPEVKLYDTIGDILRDVNAGRLGGAFVDEPILAYNLRTGFAGTRLVRSYKPVITGSVAIGLRKGDPVRAKINTALAALKADGGLQKILAKWGQA